jgi:hypothetical protein
MSTQVFEDFAKTLQKLHLLDVVGQSAGGRDLGAQPPHSPLVANSLVKETDDTELKSQEIKEVLDKTASTGVYSHDPSSMNALFEFSGDRREVDVGLSDVERKVLQREETILEDDPTAVESTLLSAGVCMKVPFSRVMVKKAKRDTTEHVDIAGVTELVFKEVRGLLKTALELRRKYMDLSLQEFCQTTAKMLDKQLPPSSAFCVPDVLGGSKFTAAGDIVSTEIRPREITPGAFTSSTDFELRFSTEMVEGVVQLTSAVEESRMSEEERAVMEDEALGSPDFIRELRTEFVDHLNAMKALSAHGPVLALA